MSIYSNVRNWWLKRRLYGKHAAILLVVVFTVMPATFAAIWLAGRSAFMDIEAKTVAAQSARAQGSMKHFEQGLFKSLGDYAYWDDSYNYMAKPNKAFEDSTLNPFTFKNMGVDLVSYVRFDGKVVFSRVVDLETQKILESESKLFADITSKGSFHEVAKSGQNHVAYIRTRRGLYVLYAQPVDTSVGNGKPIGYIVMGNLLQTAGLADALQTEVKLNLNVSPAIAQQLSKDTRPVITEQKSDAIRSHLGLFGPDGRVLGTIEFETPRNLILAGRAALIWLAMALIGGLGLIFAMLSWGIRRISVGRLQKLEAFVRDYRSGAALHPSVQEGNDEISSLGRAFAELSGQLHLAAEELTKKSYLQGKADSASGMLHNVRNALAPIRVMQEKWLREDTLPYRMNMQNALEELANPAIDPARKADLEQFLISAARKIALTSAGRIEEMEETKSSINQIAEILGGYDFDTSSGRAADIISMEALVGSARKKLDALDGPKVEISLQGVMPRAAGSRIHLIQVIDNLFVNAREAMIAHAVEAPLIVVSAQTLDDGRVEFRFKDNGDGIAPEDLAKVFQRGYSTRNHKSGGLGMHWSANAVRSMGGSIELESEGKGAGATAVLILPVAQLEDQRKAA